MMKEATENGFKCVVVNFRGTADLELTSSKLYNAAGWQDLKEPFDYLYDKYCAGNNGYKSRRIYAYGCSLGGGILNLYLIKEKEKPKLSGAIVLCASFDIRGNWPHFTTSGYGFYNTAMGFNYYVTLTRMIS
jgi:predicted alpha/beta-fold hydrolase